MLMLRRLSAARARPRCRNSSEPILCIDGCIAEVGDFSRSRVCLGACLRREDATNTCRQDMLSILPELGCEDCEAELDAHYARSRSCAMFDGEACHLQKIPCTDDTMVDNDLAPTPASGSFPKLSSACLSLLAGIAVTAIMVG
jgi:hypothetical protein